MAETRAAPQAADLAKRRGRRALARGPRRSGRGSGAFMERSLSRRKGAGEPFSSRRGPGAVRPDARHVALLGERGDRCCSGQDRESGRTLLKALPGGAPWAAFLYLPFGVLI